MARIVTLASRWSGVNAEPTEIVTRALPSTRRSFFTVPALTPSTMTSLPGMMAPASVNSAWTVMPGFSSAPGAAATPPAATATSTALANKPTAPR
jgi:hypothetical protein